MEKIINKCLLKILIDERESIKDSSRFIYCKEDCDGYDVDCNLYKAYPEGK